MIKVFLVEDEYAIREGIKKSVEWENHGFTLVGEAGDGEVAFPKILKTKPDILITDIRMPFMDGLELAKLVKNELPNIKIIVLSGYDDFNFAKQAISIGVEEYILKPVSGENLLKELGKIAEDINNQRKEEEARRKYMKDMEEIRTLEKQKFIHDMIGGRLSMQESVETAKELGIDITAAFYCIILMQIFPRNPGSSDANEYSRVNEEIYQKINDIFDGNDHVFPYEQVGDVLCLLEKADSLNDMEENIQNSIAKIKTLMADYKDHMYFISVGKPVERIRDVNSSYADANKKFAERYMCDDSFVFYGEEMPETDRVSEGLKDDQLTSDKLDIEKLDIGAIDIRMISKKTIFNFLRSGTLSEIDDLVNEYFDSIGREAVESILLRQYVLMESLLSSAALLESMGVDKDKTSEILGDMSDSIKNVDSYDKAKDFVTTLLKRVVEYRNAVSDKKYTEIIEKAKKYIRENYQNEDMSLQSVALKVNVSSNHFSTIFRKEAGETFIDFLTGVRMDKAKELLTCTSIKTSEIGFEVGYRDPHYFSYIFKKTQGVSPKEYRRIAKES